MIEFNMSYRRNGRDSRRAAPMKTAATVAIAIASIVIGKAHAADMSPIPAGAPAVAPPVTYGSYAPGAYGNYNWSGIYLGGNGGYGLSESGSSYLVSNGLTGGSGKLAGGVAGGQIGVNWQFGAFVTGLEGDLQWSGVQGSGTTACGSACTVTATENIDAFATLRARAGIAFDSVLVYGTAGGAWTNASANVNANVTGAGAAGTNLSASKLGWTAGGGIEVAVLNNWTARLEYLYIDTGNISGTATIPASLGGGTITETAAVRDNIIRVGFNYRFPITPWPIATRY
jgi:outer membrane immunogenic protein